MNQGTMNIYKPHYGGGCSNNGISAHFQEVKIWSDFDENAPENAVVIVKDEIMGEPRTRAIPARKKGFWPMFGGCFIYTCNAVVPHHGTPIALHDRFE